MYLSRLYIKNFRSIKELDLRFSRGKNVIVGRNNAGKSNIIKALDIVLGENSPTYAKSENITEKDFFTWKENVDGKENVRSADELYIWCELEREETEDLNYDEMYKCFGFYKHTHIVRWNKSGRKSVPEKEEVRIPHRSLPSDYDSIFGTDENNNQDTYINPKLRNQKTFEAEFENKYIFAYAFYACKAGEGQIYKDIRFLYRENKTKDWVLAFKAPIRNEFLQSAIIPSFRDPQNQLRLTSWSWFGKLCKHFTDHHRRIPELQQAFQTVKSIADEIFTDVNRTVSQSSLEVAFPGTTIHFQFGAEQRTDIYKDCLIYIDDGFKSPLVDKGSGIQSSTIIGLFNYYVKNINAKTSALLCIEEPEIYLHPHARRVISDRLDDFLDGNKNQVILTTHSAEFIRTTSASFNLTLVTKGDKGTKAINVNIREFKHLLIDNNQNELFFADKVIICEGYDAYLLRAIANELFPKKLDEQNISVLSTNGKNDIHTLAKFTTKLGIKTFLMADFDYLLRDKSEERKKYDAKCRASILSLPLNFFTQPCTFDSNGSKVYSRIARLRNRLKKYCEVHFYTGKTATCFGEQDVYDLLKELRQNGICILSGEIEHLSKDPSFMKAGKRKLGLDQIYDLNARINNGQKITDLIETSEIGEFLEVVFTR